MGNYTPELKKAFGIKSEFKIVFENKKKVIVEFNDGSVDERIIDYIDVVEGPLSSIEFTENVEGRERTMSTGNCNIKKVTIQDI